MRYTLSDVRSSPVALAIFALGLAAFLVAVATGPDLGSFGADQGTPLWWLGVAGVVVAVLVTLVGRIRG